MTTTGAQWIPGVQARLAAESPKDSRRSHLNPGFKVVWHASTWRRTYFRAPARVCTPFRAVAQSPRGWPRHEGRRVRGDAGTTDARALRRSIREQRRAAPASQRISAAELLADVLMSLPFMPERGHVAGYWAVDGEIGLHAWQLRLPPSLTYCLPVLHGERLRFAPWRPGGALRSNRYGIPEPDIAAGDLIAAEDMALVVAPLVAFDSRCHRIGMGAGWYDRSFAFRRDQAAPPWLVGAAFATQQVEAIAPQPWDVRMDAVCTEQRIFPAPPGIE